MPAIAPVPVAARLAPVQVIAPPPRAPGPQGSVANMLAYNPPPSPGDQVHYLTEKDLTRDELVADPWRMPYRGPEAFRNGLYHGQETWERRREYRELNRLEPAVRAAIQLKAANIASLKLSVHPRDKTKPLDVKAAKFFKWTVERCPEGVDGILRELLTPAFVDGWAVSEYTLEGIKDDVEWYGYHGLVHVTSKDTDYVKLETDEFRNVLRVVNIVRGLEYFNKEKFLIYTHNGMYANPFGQSDLAAAYRSAKLIDEAYQIWYYALETYGSPFIYGIYNSNEAGFKEQFEEVLKRMRAKGYGAIKKTGPDDQTDIKVVNLAAATSFDQFERMVDKLRQEIWTAIHGTYLPFTEGSGKDPRGNTEISQDVGPDPLSFLLALSAARCLERQLASQVTMANFGPAAGCPKIMLGGIDYAEVGRILDVAKKMFHDFKQPISKDWLREVTQVPDGDNPEDQIMPPQDGGGPGGPGNMLPPPGPGGGPTPAALPPVSPGGGTGPSPAVTGAASPSPGTTTSPSPNAPADPADQTPESDQSQNGDNWEHSEDAEIVQAAMAHAQAAGDTQTVRKLAELGSDPEALAALLADLDGPPNEKDDTPPDRRSYAWRAGTSRNGAIKAISDSGQPTVYGERARKLLENQDRVSRGETPTPRKVGGAAASAAARKQVAEGGVRRVARDVWAASKQNPTFVKPHELEKLSEHLHSLTAAELAQHLKDIGGRVSGLKADKVARLLEHIRGGPSPETKPTKPETPEPKSAVESDKSETKSPVNETATEKDATTPGGKPDDVDAPRSANPAPPEVPVPEPVAAKSDRFASLERAKVGPPGAKQSGGISATPYNESIVRPMQTGESSAPAPAQSGDQTEHAASVSKWADKSTASPEHKARFHADMTHVLSKLPPASAKVAVEALNNGSVTLHPDIKGIEDAYTKLTGRKSGKGVVGFVQSRPGDDRAHMHIDGDGGTASDLVARAIYSHEMGHAIDVGNRYSGDAKWKSAWKSEIFNGRTLLSRYARTDEAEGFAEIYKLIAEKGVETAELSYPKCVKFLKSKGLV